jgi:phospholipid/cholesterol/gamma-HCH transport system substrate-binding protein
MEPDSRYTVIGAVVLALTAAAVFAFLWLSSSGRDSDYRFYTVYFQNQSLDGLQVGAAVNMRGIPVGRVESYSIAPDNINRVKVVLRVERSTPVSVNTKASISRNFVTGIARIKLDTPGTPGPELVAVPRGERYPIIAEGQSGIDLITDSATRLAVSADGVLVKANELMGPANQQVFAELLVGLRDLAKSLNARMGTLDKTAAGLDQSLAAFRGSAERVGLSAQRLADSAEPLSAQAGATLRQADTTLQETQTALRELSQATRSLESEAARSLQTLERDGGEMLRRGDAALDVGTHELRATTQELRSAAERIARALDRLQDPRAAFLGPGEQQLGPGEAR